MTDSSETLLQKTVAALPGFIASRLQPIEKGGSSRAFYRLSADTDSVILVHDLGDKEENQHYASLADFLGGHGVPVPAVRAANHSERLLWLEDLGEQDLWSFRNESWEVRRPLYESVLRGIYALHRLPLESAEELHLQKEFDEHLYRWEQEYFTEHCLGGIFGIDSQRRTDLLESNSMQSLASRLATLPRQLVHRDFQSQNIMIRDGEAWFIDFQGMRPGLAHYDLASLLCDPYVTITPQEGAELLTYYRHLLNDDGIGGGDDFERTYWQCAVQRLMQALGAYGFLSLHSGKTAFRTHVNPALNRLRKALEQLHPEDRLDEAAEIVAHLDETKI
jgi:aminoglycoside/choline kinase family phosphotransferase